ncbi:MAG: hypothetical protein QG663_899 [Thermodesulfobacteriota bacterium]|nr:hypothetical protein [Thermodesulfobacteriota bacterium]
MWKDRLQLQKVSLFVAALLIFTVPGLTFGADFKTFTSDEYGFSMKFPPTWIKIDKPQGNYYVVFQDPDLTDNFRAKIHVAAHKPVKDQLNVFLQELRNGITDLQKGTGTAKEKQEVRILDEGEFKSEVPGAYYFFIQAFENTPKTWMDIIIVFFKFDQTLVRVSCLAPSKSMEKFHQIFNEVLLSVRFNQTSPVTEQNANQNVTTGSTGQTQAAPTLPTSPQSVAPGTQQPQQIQPSVIKQESPSATPSTTVPGAPPAPAQRPGPRGPARGSDRPATGIVN